MEFRFDSNHKLSWGYYQCGVCGTTFYNLNIFDNVHLRECYAGDEEQFEKFLIYGFGEREVENIVRNRLTQSECGKLTLQVLEEEFSDLLREKKL